MNKLSAAIIRHRTGRIVNAVRTYRKGRTHVLWLHGVLYFGGSLFVLYNALDYLIEPAARPTSTELPWFFVALAVCIVAGYLYGVLTWRSLERAFGPR